MMWRGIGRVYDLPEGQGRTPETTWEVTTIGDSRVEVGKSDNGFHYEDP